MNGPNSNDRGALGKRLKRQTFLVEIFGVVVGGGLVVEYWKEILDCFVNRHLPSLQLSGGLLVVIGVWGEVLFSRLVSTTSEKIQERADSEVSIANAQAAQAIERAALLSKETEELKKYNLKVKLALLPRRIVVGSRNGDQEIRQKRFEDVKQHAGTRALIQSVSDLEARTLAGDIVNALKLSGWEAELVSESQSRIPEDIIESGVAVITLEDFPPKPAMPLPRSVSAVVELLKLDLGPPFGPILTGARWIPEFRGFSNLERYGFEFPEGTVLILVGTRPLDSLLMADWPSTIP